MEKELHRLLSYWIPLGALSEAVYLGKSGGTSQGVIRDGS